MKSALYSKTGSVIRFLYNSWYLLVNGKPVYGFKFVLTGCGTVIAVLIPRSSLIAKRKRIVKSTWCESVYLPFFLYKGVDYFYSSFRHVAELFEINQTYKLLRITG